MTYDTDITVRTSSAVKHEAQEISDALGLDVETAINMFLRQFIIHHGLPFSVVLEPNDINVGDNYALADIVSMLADKKTLPPQNRDHKLVSSRRYKNMRECHIEADWLLIYQVIDNVLILRLVRTGTHSDLF